MGKGRVKSAGGKWNGTAGMKMGWSEIKGKQEIKGHI